MPWDEADLPQTVDHRIAAEGSRPLQMRRARDQVRVRKTVLDHMRDLFCRIFLSVLDQVPFIAALRHLIAPSVMRGNAEAERFARIVILVGSLLVFLAAALRTWGAAYLRTEVVHDTAQHSEALVADGPFATRAIRSISPTSQWRLESASWPAVSDFSGAGELDFCLPANFSRRRIPAENAGGIVSGVLPSGPAFLARAKAARSVRKSPAGLGAGIRRREFCLDIRAG